MFSFRKKQQETDDVNARNAEGCEEMIPVEEEPLPSSGAELAERIEKNVYRVTASTYFGKRTRIETKKNDNLEQLEAFWKKCREDGTLEELRAMAHPESQSFTGACANFGTHEYDYWIAVEPVDPDAEPPEGYERLEAGEGNYAQFKCKGPAVRSVSGQYTVIYNKWFPKSPYNHDDGPEIEIYPFGDMDSEEYESEILIPVRPMKTLAERIPKRRNAMLGVLFVSVGLVAGMLIAGSSDKYLVYMLIGGAVGYFVYAYIEKQKEAREKKNEHDDAESGK